MSTASAPASPKTVPNSLGSPSFPKKKSGLLPVKDRIKQLPGTLIRAVKATSVEISTLLFATTASGCLPLLQQLVIEKCCLHKLGHSEQVCNNLGNKDNEDAENATLKMAARYNMYDTSILCVIPVFVALLAGNWTDVYGRKPLIVACFVATAVQQAGLMLNVAYMSWDPIFISLLSTMPYSFGAFTTFLMLVTSYMSDITTPSERTMRLTILSLFMYGGQPLGSLAASHIFETYSSYYAAFGYLMGMAVLGGVYSAVRLDAHTHKHKQSDAASMDGSGKGSAGNEKLTHSSTIIVTKRRMLRDLMDFIGNAREALRTFSRPRRGKRRLVLVLMALALVIGFLPIYGEYNIQFLYLKKRLEWSVSQISSFSTFSICMQVFGTLACTPLFKLVLKLEDTTIGMVSVAMLASSRLIIAFATVPWMFYLSGALAMLYTVKSAVTRVIISKVVEPWEFGKAYAVVGFTEALLPMFGGIVYSESYRATVDTVPGTPYIISAACWFSTGLLYLAVHLALDGDGPQNDIYSSGVEKNSGFSSKDGVGRKKDDETFLVVS